MSPLDYPFIPYEHLHYDKNKELKTVNKNLSNLKKQLDLVKSTINSSEVKVGIAPKIPLSMRMKRLFPEGIPTKEEEMKKYLTYVKVPVYTVKGIKEKTIRIHKKLKNEAIAAFKELTNKKFLINEKEVRSAYWRPKRDKPEEISIHSYGGAIDINSGDNLGHYGRTNTNSPYCITPKFAEIMKKHGFYRGGDRSTERNDPMHFSYTDE